MIVVEESEKYGWNEECKNTFKARTETLYTLFYVSGEIYLNSKC